MRGFVRNERLGEWERRIGASCSAIEVEWEGGGCGDGDGGDLCVGGRMR